MARSSYAWLRLLDAQVVHGGRSAYSHLLWLAQSNGIGRARVAEVIDRVGLADVAKRRALALTGG